MRAKEFIREAATLRRSATAAIPGAQVHMCLDSPYNLYRFGMALAGSPDFPGDSSGPTEGMNMVTLAYSDAEQKIINKAVQTLGVDIKQLTPKGSDESSTTYTKSPVANLGPVKRKS